MRTENAEALDACLLVLQFLGWKSLSETKDNLPPTADSTRERTAVKNPADESVRVSDATRKSAAEEEAETKKKKHKKKKKKKKKK